MQGRGCILPLARLVAGGYRSLRSMAEAPRFRSPGSLHSAKGNLTEQGDLRSEFMTIRTTFAIAVFAFAPALLANNAAPLVGDTFYAPGSPNLYGATATINVGTAANNAGL